ncbi:MAG: hypothetical protein AVDCRST_MAG76-3612 [uncultured Acidimicrobiales bacterium]|uniref:Uncharacterized protein n=1 Tax=uncultured Acidimicrobiales bacterium TaxID=310071 RepID=A0A6J4JAJ6_9ACTN|nr:MAG: hypothetical protein AVDCRST_MAG76-3612 [uncultured Acidimicrobiales bacterium]
MPPTRPTTEDLLVEGLAATAVVLAERDEWDTDALRYLREMTAQVGGRTPEVFRTAAAAVTGMPLPPVESVEETERAEPMRRMLGVPSVEDRLTSALKGREWLLRLAEEHEEAI